MEEKKTQNKLKLKEEQIKNKMSGYNIGDRETLCSWISQRKTSCQEMSGPQPGGGGGGGSAETPPTN